MRSCTIEATKASLELTQHQREVLVGLLLGDGHLERTYRTPCARLKVEQSEKSREYIEWLHDIFQEWVPGGIKRKETTLEKTGKTCLKYHFTTYSHEALFPYRLLFYRGKRKIVPPNIGEILVPPGFAVWFMDDGSVKSHESRGRILNTHAFTKEEINQLCHVLSEKFELDAWPRRQSDGIQIFISGQSAETLQRLLNPYVVPSMRYKLPLKCSC